MAELMKLNGPFALFFPAVGSKPFKAVMAIEAFGNHLKGGLSFRYYLTQMGRGAIAAACCITSEIISKELEIKHL